MKRLTIFALLLPRLVLAVDYGTVSCKSAGAGCTGSLVEDKVYCRADLVAGSAADGDYDIQRSINGGAYGDTVSYHVTAGVVTSPGTFYEATAPLSNTCGGTPTTSVQIRCTAHTGTVVTYTATNGGCVTGTAVVQTANQTLRLDGSASCGSTTATNVSLTNSTGFNTATNVHVNVFVGASGSGYNMNFFFNGTTTSQSLTIPAAVGDVLDGGPVSVSIVEGSYAYDSHDAPITFTVSTPSTFHCGTALTVALIGSTTSGTPTPSPSVVPSPSASASATPRPTASPVITPGPFGSPTPAGAPTPPPNVSVSNGGPKTDTIIDNPNDFYGPVLKALEDAGRGNGAPNDGNGGGGAFGSGNGTHDTGNYDERGHLDDLQDKADEGVTSKTGVVSDITGRLNALTTKAISLGGQTFGNVTSITMNFNSIGTAATVGHVTLPTTIDLVPWSTMITTLRVVLLWLIRIAFFILTFRLCASQGVRV